MCVRERERVEFVYMCFNTYLMFPLNYYSWLLNIECHYSADTLGLTLGLEYSWFCLFPNLLITGSVAMWSLCTKRGHFWEYWSCKKGVWHGIIIYWEPSSGKFVCLVFFPYNTVSIRLIMISVRAECECWILLMLEKILILLCYIVASIMGRLFYNCFIIGLEWLYFIAYQLGSFTHHLKVCIYLIYIHSIYTIFVVTCNLIYKDSVYFRIKSRM